MGGAVSSGRDNNELIDNLMGGNYIRTRDVERVFRALDRAEYMTPEARDQAYKDLAWRNGPLHMSAPCIYSEVMEGLELKPGLSFLNVGSGTGYLSTLVGLILGSSGISHGIEVHPLVVEYANKKLGQFMENSPTLDEFDFCEPKFYGGNGLCLAPLQAPYDRVYCGAGCPEEYQNYFQQLIKVGGILVMPLNDNLLQVRRTGVTEWSTRSLLNVSFATLRVPTKEEARELIRLDEQGPSRLQVLARAVIRQCMRGAMRRRHPQLVEPPPRAPPAKKACPRRICIPVDDDSDAEGLNALHDLDRVNGATEMNALLSLVLSMGRNRVAGALRVDPLDDPSDSSSDDRDDDDDDNDDGDNDGGGDGPDNDGAPVAAAEANSEPQSGPEGSRTENAGRAPLRNVIILYGSPDNEAGDEARDAATALPRVARRDHPAPPRRSSDTASSSSNRDEDDVDISKLRRINRTRKSSKKSSAQKRESRRRSRGSRSSEDKRGFDDDQPNPEVPAEVEIYLGKSREEPGTSTMEWDHAEPVKTEEKEVKPEHSSEEETTESNSKSKEEKRQKLDSGVGEENSPSVESSPQTSKGDESASDRHSSGSDSDEGCEEDVKGRRRRQKRGHLSTRSSSSTDEDMDITYPEGGGVPIRRPRRRGHSADDRRRVSLSIFMKRGVKELPLPHALKKFVNLNRCFEF